MNPKKIAVVIGLLLLIAAFFVFDFGRFFSLDYIKGARRTSLPRCTRRSRAW